MKSRADIQKEVTEKFWSQVDIREPDECWEWQGSRDVNGYGTFCILNENYRAHRVAWMFSGGAIPKDNNYCGTMYICHHCDNPPCVNPKHLFVGTQKDNMQDCHNKGRNADMSRDFHGQSKMTTEDVRIALYWWSLGNMSKQMIADHFGVKRPTIHRIIKLSLCRK